MARLTPPADSPAPIQVGMGNAEFTPDADGVWDIDDHLADELRHAGWTDAVDGQVPSPPPAEE